MTPTGSPAVARLRTLRAAGLSRLLAGRLRNLAIALSLVTLAAGAIMGVSLASSLEASAAGVTGSLGSLTFNPGSGTDLDAFSVNTSKGCPGGSTNVTGLIQGPGGWATGFVAFSNNSAAVSTTSEFSVPMSNSMAVIASNNAVPIVVGQYDITVTCQTALGTSKFGTFAGSIWFTTTTSWTSADPAAPGATPTPTSSGTASPTPSPTASPTASLSASPTPSVSPTLSPSAGSTTSSSASPSVSPSTGGAGTLGGLKFVPETGSDIDPIEVFVVSSDAAKGCPTGGTNVTGRITGPGDWAKGVVAFTNSSATVSSTADFSVPMSNSFKVIAANNQLALVAGKYDITVTCQNLLGTTKFGTFVGSLWFTDATHFQSKDPSSSQTETQVAVTVTPQFRADLGVEVSFVATMNPATAVGKIQFRENVNNSFTSVGPALDVANGTATLKLSTLAFGLHRVSAVFTPTSDKVFKASTSAEIVYVVAKPIPPLPPAKASLAGTPKVGSSLTCAATFRNATSSAFAWLRNRSPIAGATSNSYRLVAADKGKSVQCRASATNAGGTTSRTSAALGVS